MTKEEALQGALALNDSNPGYTVTVKDDKITIEAKYYGTPKRKATFRYTARLRDDGTYTETCFNSDGYDMQYGYFDKTQKTALHTLGGENGTPVVEKEYFNSKDVKKVLRDYLESYGYKRKRIDPVKLALCIVIPAAVIAFIIVAVVMISSATPFVDTNGPDNFALTEITRDDILSHNNSYRSSMVSEKHSGHHTNIIGTRLRDCDYDHISKSFGKIHGVVILQATKISGNTLTLSINSSIESGNAEIIILIDGEYHSSVDVNQNRSVTLQNVAGKEVLVKLAAEDAKLKIDVSRTY